MDRVRDKLEAGFGENTRLSYEDALSDAEKTYADQLETENTHLFQISEAQGGGFTPRDAPLFDM